ncbi:MAG: HDOD domain-containing protein [Deltaproteobacteria bacterium]|nr:HDOD domain-containing protein [Deltaproteobacteria bacterium]
MVGALTFNNANSAESVVIGGVPVPREAAEALHRLSEIRTIPEAARKVRQIASDPAASVKDMAAAISSDPAMASKLLKLANSAFYGLPTRVGNVERAIVLLGFKTVQNLALAGSICRLFRESAASKGFGGRDLWEHCLAVAVAAKTIAARIGKLDVDEAFLGGITHDVGLLAIRDAFPEKLAATIDLAAAGKPFLEAERALLGTTHAELGAALTAVWKFPEFLRETCRCHHAPELAQPQFARLVHCIHIADCLCGRNHIGFYLTSEKSEIQEESLEAIGLDDDDLEGIERSLDRDLPEARGIFL